MNKYKFIFQFDFVAVLPSLAMGLSRATSQTVFNLRLPSCDEMEKCKDILRSDTLKK